MDGAIRLIDGVEQPRRMAVLDLLRAYAASLPVSLDFQDFEQELAAFPSGYEPPEGSVTLACKSQSREVVGLVCVRRLLPDCCEMKRLYVMAEARGSGLGRRLAGASMARARALGYRRMRLDTLAMMSEAIALYLSLGFVEISNYNGNPVPGARFFERRVD